MFFEDHFQYFIQVITPEPLKQGKLYKCRNPYLLVVVNASVFLFARYFDHHLKMCFI